MSSPIRLVRPGVAAPPANIQDFLTMFSAQAFDRIEREVLRARNTFDASMPIRNHQEFCHHAIRFHMHVQQLTADASVNPITRPELALHELSRWYKGDLDTAERNAIYEREGGGFIGVIDQMTKNLIEERKHAYVEQMFFEHLPVDQEARIRLAEELCKKFKEHFPDAVDLKVPAILAFDIKRHIIAFAEVMNAARRGARW